MFNQSKNCRNFSVRGERVRACVTHSTDVLHTAGMIADIALRECTTPHVREIAKRASVRGLWEYLRSIYQTERGEILQTPRVTDLIQRADCDDQAIYMLSVLMAKGAAIDALYIILAGNHRITHVYPAIRAEVRLFKLDMLPQSQWGAQYRWPTEEAHRLDSLL